MSSTRYMNLHTFPARSDCSGQTRVKITDDKCHLRGRQWGAGEDTLLLYNFESIVFSGM